jgi:hypothetical protein
MITAGRCKHHSDQWKKTEFRTTDSPTQSDDFQPMNPTGQRPETITHKYETTFNKRVKKIRNWISCAKNNNRCLFSLHTDTKTYLKWITDLDVKAKTSKTSGRKVTNENFSDCGIRFLR